MPENTRDQPYVFVSYASVDRERVLPLVERLEAAGVKTWIDRDGIHGGANYAQVIAAAIKDSTVVLVLCSAAALTSRNVRQELALGWRFEKPYLPLLLEPVAMPDEVAYWLEATQWISLFERPEEQWLTDLAGALRNHGFDVRLVPTHLRASLRRERPPVAGREREMRRLAQRLDVLRSGRGGVVLIGGEAGVGKTTLATVALHDAQEMGFAVLEGRCFDLTETPPYGPWVDLFLHLPPLGSIPLPEAFAVPGTVGRVPSQLALFAQVERFLTSFTARQPAALFLEDLHWSDPASLDLVRYLAPAVTSLPLLILVTYRSDELTRGHPLGALLPQLARDPDTERIDLGRLEEPAVRELVARRYALPDDEAARLSAHVYRRTEGHALFVVELLRALEETGEIAREGDDWSVGDLSGSVLPPLLRQVIEGRVARFDGESRRLLEVASVVGHTLPLDIWARVGEVDEDALLDVAEQAVAAQLLVGMPDGRSVSFGHALIRESLYDGISSFRRRRLHQRTGEVLERAAAGDLDPVSAQLGHHFQLAGMPERAVPHLLHAGDLAQQSHSHANAIAYFRRARTLCASLAEHGQRDEWRELEARACEGLGASLLWTGDPSDARSVLQGGLELAGDVLRRARLWLLVGRAWFADGNDREGLRSYHQAEAELGPEPETDPDAWWQARIDIFLQRLVSLYFSSGSYARGEELQALIAEFRDPVQLHGTPRQRVVFLHRAHLARIRRDRYVVSPEVLDNIRLANSIAAQLDDPALRCELQFSVGFAELWYGDLEGAHDHFSQSLALADRIGNQWQRVLIFTYLSVLARRRGDVELAEQRAREGLAAAQAVEGQQQYVGAAKANLAWVAWRRGDDSQAETHGREALAVWEHHALPFKWLAVWPLVDVSLRRGDLARALDDARRLLEPALQPPPDELRRLIDAAIQAQGGADPARAEAWLNEALSRARELGYL